MSYKLKFSIITVCYNSENTIRETIESLFSQNYKDIEYILVDGNSKDNTINIVNEYRNKFNIIISENDHGMYDALNKGILAASGDIIGILNSDDIYSNTKVLELLANEFNKNPNFDALIGDVAFKSNDKILRYYSSKNWNPSKFKFGMMPAHPSFYCKRELFYKYGLYDTRFKIAGDFELLLRFFLINKINYKYLPLQMVDMKLGGLSTSGFKSLYRINKEIKLAFKINSLKSNYIILSFRYFHKIFQYLFF
jgi:glycosyltransferase involved in cell wall biosynthesis